MIAHGKYDNVRSIEHAEMLYKNIKNSEMIFLEAGHSPMYEDYINYSKALEILIKKI
jgi:pimeloyl-ACP methyl ester carboxylesterase